LRIVVALLLLGGTAAAEGPKRVLRVTHAGGYMHDRRVPGQLGTLAYQPTPQGLEEMKTAGDYAHAAANIERMELAS
jgi:hypothetical protein